MSVHNVKKLFPMLSSKNLTNHPIVYLDNAATTFKPESVINAINKYLTQYSTNSHRGDYFWEVETDKVYEQARKDVAEFINANVNEIIFTSGTTHASNQVAYSFSEHAEVGDEILMSKHEHTSNMLPWFELAKNKKMIIKYFDISNDPKITLVNFKKALNQKTHFVVTSLITNVWGIEIPVELMAQELKDHKAHLIVDAAQAISHIKVDVKKLEADALFFSFHKMYGPTGLGALYLKEKWIERTKPLIIGGGMNEDVFDNGTYTYKRGVSKFEAGTQNLMAISSVSEVIKFIKEHKLEDIHTHEINLANHLKSALSKNNKVEVYNKDTNSAIVTFNVKNVFCQDVAHYLSNYGICVRCGEHCAKLLEHNGVKNVLRASFAIYNTIEDVNKLVDILEKAELKDYVGAAL